MYVSTLCVLDQADSLRESRERLRHVQQLKSAQSHYMMMHQSVGIWFRGSCFRSGSGLP